MTKSRKLVAFLLMAVLTFTVFTTQAFAAGTETWYGAWVDEPTMTVKNNNLTPVKTMGETGTLHLACGIKW